VQRGHDPRDFSLAAFGGAGPMHAAALAGDLQIREVVCPPIPGAFSALGLVGTDLKRDYVRTFYATTAAADPAMLEQGFADLEAIGAAMLDRAQVAGPRRRFIRSVDARYVRQSYELSVPVPDGRIDQEALARIADAFHARHRQTYGHDNASEPVQLVNIRVAAVGGIPALRIRQETAPAGSEPLKKVRAMWFRSSGLVEAGVYNRALMPAGCEVQGPAVIESLESTILVPPGWAALMDGDGFVILTSSAKGARP
jgi:N-methylhydantoinase A